MLRYTKKHHHALVLCGLVCCAATIWFDMPQTHAALLNLAINIIWLFEPSA